MNNFSKLIVKAVSIMILVLGMIACSSTQKVNEDTISKITNPQLKTTLNKVFDNMGGLENWQQLQSLKFRKKTILYLEDGQIEKINDQQHHYEYKPMSKIHISWNDTADRHLIEMTEEGVVKKVNQKIDATANLTALKNSVLAATFVIGVPFKIMDAGTTLSYVGMETMNNGKEVHVVKATYDPKNFEHHTKSDIWWHYFDKDTYEQLGYSVELHDHTSYIENLTFERVGGFLFTTSRKSWRMNDKGEKLYVRAEYEYSDFEVQ